MTSEHFSELELHCKHCGINNVVPELLHLAESVRALLGLPMKVHCAYRCPEHNKKVGGSPKSQHMLGKAMDFHVLGMSHEKAFTALKLAHAAGRLPALGGLGLYDWGLHIDCRTNPAGQLLTWDSRTKGHV